MFILILTGFLVLVSIILVYSLLKLRQSQQKYKNIIEKQALLLNNIQTQIWYLKDPETCGSVNNARANFLGLKPEQLENRKIYDFLSREDAEKCIDHNRKVFEEKKQASIKEWVKNGNGEKRLLATNKTPKLNDSGFVEYVVCSAEDITGRFQAELKLKEYATYDQLTKVYNRRVGLAILKEKIKEADRENIPLTICFVDTDNLKEINDKFGHLEGDKLIINTIGTIKEKVRKIDVICRLGGDEFLIIFPHCSLENAKKIMTRVKLGFDDLNKKHGRLYSCDISYGLAEYNPACKMSIEELICVADQRMYQEKRKN